MRGTSLLSYHPKHNQHATDNAYLYLASISPVHVRPALINIPHLQYRWISHDFVELRKLKIAYIVKGIIAGLLILLAIAFAIALYKSTNTGGAYFTYARCR